ncbi:L-alanine-DL-glutamate epimerase [Jatrophihabitans endophyticus]|uniref:L-alanine-DL-glutamate epimerase n=1 Tax=Jatrophihabitans endophyticus TaxID=1206085 RepID=A0A1M5PZV3_9ACTN|nr:enolase C-terminal domain-like protein [Jatrophihabitans endophyticus]SHH07071.1 L-alanine-DL-glutamate epimerase [Jatrophihabitans endophyticus]
MRVDEVGTLAADDLSPTRIADVRVEVYDRPHPTTPADTMIGSEPIGHLLTECVAVRITTAAGVTGESLSLGGGLGLGHYIAKWLRPFLIGKDLRFLEAIWQGMWSRNRLWFLPQFAIGTVDVALWDAFARTLDLPLWQLLGGYRASLPTYASSMSHPTVAEYVDEALLYQRRNFAGYKLHTTGDVAFDIDCCREVRAAVGPDMALMVDAVGAYSQVEALRVGAVLQELDYHWFEEPLHDWDVHGLKWLADELAVPIAALETNEGSMFSSPELITTRAVDIVRSDVSFKGGVTPVKKTAALAEAFGMNLEVHTNAGNPLLDAANLAVALSIKNTEFYEQLVPEEAFSYPVIGSIDVGEDGRVSAPDGSGLGVRVDWDQVAEFSVGVL